MKVLAVILSGAIVIGFYFLVWSQRLEELKQLEHNRADIQTGIQAWPSRLASLPELERGVKTLERQVAKAQAARRLPKDPPLEKMGAHLKTEWKPLTERPGLKVESEVNLQLHSGAALYVDMTAEGPKDEIFRLLDGLARSPRPIQFETLDMECTDDRARLSATFQAYYP